MDEQLRIILTFGLLVYVFVKNYIKSKIKNLKKQKKNKKLK